MDEKTLSELIAKANAFKVEPEDRRRPDGIPDMDMELLPWQETVSFILVDLYDAVMRAKKIIEARQPKYKRIAGRVLKLTEALIYIIGWIASKNFTLLQNLENLFKKGA